MADRAATLAEGRTAAVGGRRVATAQAHVSSSKVKTSDDVAAAIQALGGSKKGDLDVVDNWPDIVPVTRDEVDVLEIYLGDVLDDILGGVKGRK